MFEKKYKIEKKCDGYWYGYRKHFILGWLYVIGTISDTKEECRDAMKEVVLYGGVQSRVEYMTQKELLQDE